MISNYIFYPPLPPKKTFSSVCVCVCMWWLRNTILWLCNYFWGSMHTFLLILQTVVHSLMLARYGTAEMTAIIIISLYPYPSLASLTCSTRREVTPIIPRSGTTARPCSRTAGPCVASCSASATVLGGHGVHVWLLALWGGGLRGQFSVSRCAGWRVESAAHEGHCCLAGSVAACRRLPPAVGGQKTLSVK